MVSVNYSSFLNLRPATAGSQDSFAEICAACAGTALAHLECRNYLSRIDQSCGRRKALQLHQDYSCRSEGRLGIRWPIARKRGPALRTPLSKSYVAFFSLSGLTLMTLGR
jgi:hypothetical protein